jgi:hypothetical protein
MKNLSNCFPPVDVFTTEGDTLQKAMRSSLTEKGIDQLKTAKGRQTYFSAVESVLGVTDTKFGWIKTILDDNELIRILIVANEQEDDTGIFKSSVCCELTRRLYEEPKYLYAKNHAEYIVETIAFALGWAVNVLLPKGGDYVQQATDNETVNSNYDGNVKYKKCIWKRKNKEEKASNQNKEKPYEKERDMRKARRLAFLFWHYEIASIATLAFGFGLAIWLIATGKDPRVGIASFALSSIPQILVSSLKGSFQHVVEQESSSLREIDKASHNVDLLKDFLYTFKANGKEITYNFTELIRAFAVLVNITSERGDSK